MKIAFGAMKMRRSKQKSEHSKGSGSRGSYLQSSVEQNKLKIPILAKVS